MDDELCNQLRGRRDSLYIRQARCDSCTRDSSGVSPPHGRDDDEVVPGERVPECVTVEMECLDHLLLLF